ncbi:MAG: cytochrome c [Elusimicrobia bacterium]|nr:cytochrome c [Elusimicrobiota bacterium]
MKDRGSLNLVVLVLSVWAGLFLFYGFLAYRARLWSPLWAISPTEKVFAALAEKSRSLDEDSPILKGRLLYREFRCGVCHGPEGEGGVKNPNADPDGVVPNLYDLGDAFTFNDLKDKIRKGTHPAKLEEKDQEPPLDMPSWEKTLSGGELEDLAQYLFSLKSPPGSREEEEE